MKILSPVTITDDMYVSCTIPETDYPAWSSSTAYVIGNYVIILATHKVYVALTNNTNKPPATSATDWQEVGYTNRWEMFDRKVGTTTSATTSFTTVIKPGVINALGFVNLTAASVQVVMTDPVDGVVFDHTYQTYDNSEVSDWYWYFFAPIRRKDTLVITDLPSYRNAEISITLTETTGETASLGALLAGRLYSYAIEGKVLAGASVGIQDYSRKDTDDWGNTYIVERAYSKRAQWSYLINNKDLDSHQKLMTSIRATTCLFIGGRFDATVIYGFLRDFDVVIEYANHSECSCEIEGLT